jgi:hypothetical protein
VLNDPVNLVDPSGLIWVYDQSTGQMIEVGVAGIPFPVGQGYSGNNNNGLNMNNPNSQGIGYNGPIPQGGWSIGAQTHSNRTGAGVLPLTPINGTNTYNRNAFQVHGDNRWRSNNASDGCIVIGRGVRDRIAGSNDTLLWVVP